MDSLLPQIGLMYVEHGKTMVQKISDDPEFLELAKAEAYIISEDEIKDEMLKNPSRFKRPLAQFDAGSELIKRRRDELAEKVLTDDRTPTIQNTLNRLMEAEAYNSLDASIHTYEDYYMEAFPPTKTDLMNLGVYKTEDFVASGHKGIAEGICIYCVEEIVKCSCACVSCERNRDHCKCVDFTTDETLQGCLEKLREEVTQANIQGYYHAILDIVKRNRVMITRALKSCPEANIVCPICYRSMKKPGRMCKICRTGKLN